MSASMMLWMLVPLTYQNMCITLKILLLHLKSDFITLKSSEELAALDVMVKMTWLLMMLAERCLIKITLLFMMMGGRCHDQDGFVLDDVGR